MARVAQDVSYPLPVHFGAKSLSSGVGKEGYS